MISILVSGVLVNPFNRPLPNAIITLTSISNSFTVLTGANVTARTNDEGEYEFHLQPGNYAVYVAKESYRDFYGAITITATTPPTTLNVLLKQNTMEAELQPDLVAFFQQVQNQVVVAGNGADEAARIADEKANAAAISEQNAGAYSGVAVQSASLAGESAATAEEIASKLGDLEQLIRDAGGIPVDSFEQGYTLTSIGQALRQELTGVFYSWRGSYPKVVPPGSTPESTGGISSTAWVDVNDLTLRSTLKSNAPGNGGSIVAITQGGTVQDAITYLTPEMYGAVGDGVADDSDAIIKALLVAEQDGIKDVFLGSAYNVTKAIVIPDDVCMSGAGNGTGLLMINVPISNLQRIISMPGKNSQCRNFGIKFNTSGTGSIAAVRVYGIFLESTSSNCKVDNVNIVGKYNGSDMGFSHGIRITGKSNSVTRCHIEYCSMGITYRGIGHIIDSNYVNNHYLTDGIKPWSSLSPHWDGICGEGASHCQITNNITEENGQSGVYLGGNGSLSYNNLIQGNVVNKNWNKGIDCGISGNASDYNNVNKLRIVANHCTNNRDTQLWGYGISDSLITNNIVEITDVYDSIFEGYQSKTISGLALGYTAACVNNVVTNNRVMTRSKDPYSIVANGTNNTVKDNITSGAQSYFWSNDANRLLYNNISNYISTFSPRITSGIGVSITSGSGKYCINGNVLSFTITLMLSGINPGGTLSIGYLPGVANASMITSNINVVTYDEWLKMDGVLSAYQDGTNKDQIVIYRNYQGVRRYDAASYVSTASTIIISGTIEAQVKTFSTPSISFFGHSFLSDQNFANKLSELTNRYVYNFARGGSSSQETALVAGAYVNNYTPIGGIIPASGQVTLAPAESGVWWSGAWANCTIAGVDGVISSSSTGVSLETKLTFSRSSSGSVVNVSSATPLIIKPTTRTTTSTVPSGTSFAAHADSINVLWIGRNTINGSITQVVADMQAIVESLGSNKKFVVLAEFPYNNEKTNSAAGVNIANMNIALKAAFPENYCQINGVDILQNFKNHYNPANPQDVTDIANGVTPSSLRSDNIHPSNVKKEGALYVGTEVNAEFIFNFMKSKGWIV